MKKLWWFIRGFGMQIGEAAQIMWHDCIEAGRPKEKADGRIGRKEAGTAQGSKVDRW